MTVGALLLQVRRAPHLPPLSGLDHGDVVGRLGTCLSDDYRVRVRELAPARTATPASLRRELFRTATDLGRLDGLVVHVRSHLTVFERAGSFVCGLALRDSVRGRPAGMTDLREFVEAVTDCFPEAGVVLCLDVDVLAARIGGAPPTPARVIDHVVKVVSQAGGHRVSTVVTTHNPIPVESPWPVVPLARAANDVLRAASANGRELTSVDLAERVGAYLAASGQVAGCQLVGSPFTLRPQPRSHTLPDYVIDDLYSPDPGSRLDAVVELVELTTAGDTLARSQLDDIRSGDPSAQVRGFAQTLWRQSDTLSARQLLDFGLIPRPVWERAGQNAALPELTDWFTGTGTMGVDAPLGQHFERPAHAVTVSPFRMARRPVTNHDYLVFVAATDSPCPDHWDSEWAFRRDLDHPVVMVSWHDARRYCAWLTESSHRCGILDTEQVVVLPTEAEWEIAAREADERTHPWGSFFDQTRCNVRSAGIGHVRPVGTFSPRGDSGSGVVDLIGNVWEWTASAWGSSGRQPSYGYPYDPTDGREDANLPAGVRRIVRGGAFYYADICANSYTRNRALPTDRHLAGGFRVAVRRR